MDKKEKATIRKQDGQKQPPSSFVGGQKIHHLLLMVGRKSTIRKQDRHKKPPSLLMVGRKSTIRKQDGQKKPPSTFDSRPKIHHSQRGWTNLTANPPLSTSL
ncbi:hypothetical protein AVEN_153079-1 [Araneus ventricosus]|uniref:Uncharacterized protein n=1 Tax=Araneus ventricosus TaxID=182803 RepID=A0A4Y2E2Z2_ARAVE|nr:hypothetical protein AVEN_153079-1 [Araneus ventricosus]